MVQIHSKLELNEITTAIKMTKEKRFMDEVIYNWSTKLLRLHIGTGK